MGQNAISADIAAIIPELTAWRHDLHAHPELAYQEKWTSAFVAETLLGIGCDVTTGIATTGVVGVLDFGPGPLLGIRADMDALPLNERTGVAYASQNDGVMHACGHDGHTTMGLGAAKIIATQKAMKGKVVFIFQPAEENEGGARQMVEEGLFSRFAIDAVFGLHNLPGVPVGEIRAREGAMSAAFDTFDISLAGEGGHGAMPEHAVDPIAAASALVAGLNTIISRNVAPLESAVLSVCALNSGEAYNVIPSTANIKGSCRSFGAAAQLVLKDRVQAMVDGVAQAYGVTAKLIYENRYPAVINSAKETNLVRAIAQDPKYGWHFNKDFQPLMGSEDFSFYLKEKPGCFFIIGNGNGGGPLHSPTYNFNDAALPVGVEIWAQLAARFLASQ